MIDVTIVDSELNSKVFTDRYEHENINPKDDECNMMFVNFTTSKGVLQFVAYNRHNGYYSHLAFRKGLDKFDPELDRLIKVNHESALDVYNYLASGISGASISRTYIDDKFARQRSIELTPEQEERKGGLIWCLSLGCLAAPKVCYYAQTIKELVKLAKKDLKEYQDESNY